jgi:glycosyltransferase involved in cell wall biosynthesis
VRVLIATHHLNIVGGVETYLRDLLPALRERGHAVAQLASVGAGTEGTPIAPPDVPTWGLAGSDRGSVFRAVEAWAPEVVFSHGMASPADEGAVLDRFPTVLFAHGHQATCVSGSRTHAFPTLRPCDKKFGPGCLVHYFPRRCGGLNPVTMLRLYRRASRRSAALSRYAAVVVASRYMADEYRAHGVPDDRLCLAPLFPTGQVPSPVLPDHPPTDRVLFVGRLYPDKGAGLVVEAVAGAADRLGRPLTLVVAGEGPERAGMEARAARRNVRAEFHGWVGPDRRVDLMRGADLLAVPSLCPETFGLVGVEAGCVGLPAVGFAVGGIPDWLVPGVSGELAPGDPPTGPGLAEAIARALADPAHLRRLSVGAWERAHTFSREAHVARVEAVLLAAAGAEPAYRT